MKIRSFYWLCILCSLLFSTHVHAAVFYVKPVSVGSANASSWSNAKSDLQAVINQAHSGDSIWVAAGTYIPNHLAANLTTINSTERTCAIVLKAGVKIFGGFAGTETKFSQRNTTTNVTTLSGDRGRAGLVDDNLFHIVISSGAVTGAELNGFTISNAYSADYGNSGTVNSNSINNTYGAGVYIVNSSPILSNLIIASNSTVYGGAGIYCSGGTPTISNVDITSSTVTNGSGASVYLDASSATLSNCTISGGTATYNGGGIYCTGGSPTIKNSNIYSCTASNGGGGGIALFTYSTASITNCKIHDNNAIYSGGGLYIDSSTPVMTNILVYKNTASQHGGGIRTVNCTPVLNNATIVYNSVSVDYGRGGLEGNANVRNSIIWGNTANSGSSNYDNSTFYYSIVQGARPTGTSVLAADNPAFTSVSTDDYTVKGYSPAVNAGNNAYNSTTTDLAGNPRIFSTSTIDLGAYEYQSTDVSLPARFRVVYVKAGASGNGTSWSSAYGQLSDALTEASNSYEIAQIWVAAGTYIPQSYAGDGTWSQDKAFVLPKNVLIYGGFAGTETSLTQRNWATNVTVLSGGNSVNHVLISSGDVGSTSLDGFTISGGSASNAKTSIAVNYNTIYCQVGGGMYCYNSSPILKNLIFKQNSSVDKAAALACISSSSPTITNCLIANNSAAICAGIYSENSLPVIVSSTVASNRNSYNPGAGLSGPMIVKNSIIWNNTSNQTTLYNNISSTNDITFSACLLGGGAGVTGVVSVADPGFANASTGDYTLKYYSSAINAGNNAYNSQNVDLANKPRVFGNAVIDLGAYEFQSYGPIRTIYVKAGATGNGTSWANAYGQLSSALTEASTSTDVAQIWVAAGSYSPQTIAGNGTRSRDKSFVLVPNVKIYGGFSGIETDLNQRNWKTNITYLDGANAVEHVVISSGDVGTATLDGFTIIRGNSGYYGTITVNSNTIYTSVAGGLYCCNSSPFLNNMIFTGNTTVDRGAAIYCAEASAPTITNSLIYGNSGTNSGGIYCDIEGTTIINSTITGNRNTNTGYGGAGVDGPLTIRNSIIWNNSSGVGTYGSNVGWTGTKIFSNCLIEGASIGSGIISSSNPQFTNAASNDYTLSSGSPAINVGRSSYISTYSYDLNHNQRIMGSAVDLGAFEFGVANKWVGSVSTDPQVAANWSSGTVLADDNVLEFASNAQRDMVLTRNRSFSNISNFSSKKIVLNGLKLTIKGALSVTSPIDASATNSTVEFAGSTQQNFHSSSFLNDSVYSININNASNVLLRGNLHVRNSIARTTGYLDASSNFPSVYWSGSTLNSSFLNGTVFNLTLYSPAGITLADDFTVTNTLTIAQNSSLTIPATRKMTVSGSLVNNAGVNGLLVKASPTLAHGTLIFRNSQSAPLYGTVEMYSKAFKDPNGPTGYKYKWQFFGIPIRSVIANDVFSNSYVKRYVETNPAAQNLVWVNQVNSSVLNSFAGYEITQNAATTLTFQGILENADMNLNLTYTAGSIYPGQHIISNPYCSAIDITKLVFTNMEKTVYLYNTGSLQDWTNYLGNTIGLDDNYSPGQYIASTIFTAGNAGIPSEIPPMQGFEVKAYTGGGNISYSYGTSVKSTTVQHAKSSVNASTRSYIAFQVKGTKSGDKLWMFNNSSCSDLFDNGWDAYKVTGNASSPQLYTVAGSGNYQIDCRNSYLNANVAFRAGEDSVYTLTVTHQNVDTTGGTLYLWDKVTNKVYDLSADTVTITFKDKSTTAYNRFGIVNKAGMPTTVATPTAQTDITIYRSDRGLHISNPESREWLLTIYDINTRVLYSGKIISAETDIPFAPGKGTYIVKLVSAAQERTKCIIF